MIVQIRQNPQQVTHDMFGMRTFLIIPGLFKKTIISDYISLTFVDRIFEDPLLYTEFENLTGVYGYVMQISCEFSGYSDMAIGVAVILGCGSLRPSTRPLNWRRSLKSGAAGVFRCRDG